jgi:hypothetical protein
MNSISVEEKPVKRRKFPSNCDVTDLKHFISFGLYLSDVGLQPSWKQSSYAATVRPGQSPSCPPVIRFNRLLRLLADSITINSYLLGPAAIHLRTQPSRMPGRARIANAGQVHHVRPCAPPPRSGYTHQERPASQDRTLLLRTAEGESTRDSAA